MTSFSYWKIHCRSAAVIGDLPIYAADFQFIICVQSTQRGFLFKKLSVSMFYFFYFFSDTKLLQIPIKRMDAVYAQISHGLQSGICIKHVLCILTVYRNELWCMCTTVFFGKFRRGFPTFRWWTRFIIHITQTKNNGHGKGFPPVWSDPSGGAQASPLDGGAAQVIETFPSMDHLTIAVQAHATCGPHQLVEDYKFMNVWQDSVTCKSAAAEATSCLPLWQLIRMTYVE